jgi:hypothetical protein
LSLILRKKRRYWGVIDGDDHAEVWTSAERAFSEEFSWYNFATDETVEQTAVKTENELTILGHL